MLLYLGITNLLNVYNAANLLQLIPQMFYLTFDKQFLHCPTNLIGSQVQVHNGMI